MINYGVLEVVTTILAVFTALSSFLSWMTRQQMLVNKLEMEKNLAAMELRLTEKIGASFVTWPSHNDLSARVDKLEDRIP